MRWLYNFLPLLLRFVDHVINDIGELSHHFRLENPVNKSVAPNLKADTNWGKLLESRINRTCWKQGRNESKKLCN